MLENWLVPSEHVLHWEEDEFEVWQLGHVMQLYTSADDFPEVSTGAVALIGLDAAEADRVRSQLYKMARPSEEIQLFDLGNARRSDGVFNAPLMQELLVAGVTPLFIGRESERCLAQYYGYHHAEYLTNLVCIDDRLRFQARDVGGPKQYLDYIFDLNPVRLFHLAVLGYQTHYNDPAALEYLHQHHFEFYKLGMIKYDIDECEPVLRDADAVTFHLSALKASDAHAQEPLGSSGLSSEEACQLARFAGMADKVSSYGLYGYYAERDPSAQCADTVAQLAWYFIEGFAHRKYDFPVTTEGLTEFIVRLDGLSPELKFWKSERTGRWWLEIPYKLENTRRHQYIACTYADYERACDQQLPNRLIEAYKRFV